MWSRRADPMTTLTKLSWQHTGLSSLDGYGHNCKNEVTVVKSRTHDRTRFHLPCWRFLPTLRSACTTICMFVERVAHRKCWVDSETARLLERMLAALVAAFDNSFETGCYFRRCLDGGLSLMSGIRSNEIINSDDTKVALINQYSRNIVFCCMVFRIYPLNRLY